MDRYIGTNIVFAGACKAWKDFGTHPQGEDGYKIKYEFEPKFVRDGDESWCPKDVFERAYRPVTGMTFGIALECLKAGHKVSRKGWNGKGLFVVYQKGYPDGIPCNKQTADAWGLEEGELFKCEPYLQINTVDGSHAMWVPSIRDCFADDWQIVE